MCAPPQNICLACRNLSVFSNWRVGILTERILYCRYLPPDAGDLLVEVFSEEQDGADTLVSCAMCKRGLWCSCARGGERGGDGEACVHFFFVCVCIFFVCAFFFVCICVCVRARACVRVCTFFCVCAFACACVLVLVRARVLVCARCSTRAAPLARAARYSFANGGAGRLRVAMRAVPPLTCTPSCHATADWLDDNRPPVPDAGPERAAVAAAGGRGRAEGPNGHTDGADGVRDRGGRRRRGRGVKGARRGGNNGAMTHACGRAACLADFLSGYASAVDNNPARIDVRRSNSGGESWPDVGKTGATARRGRKRTGALPLPRPGAPTLSALACRSRRRWRLSPCRCCPAASHL